MFAIRHITGNYFIEHNGSTGWGEHLTEYCKLFDSLKALHKFVESNESLSKLAKINCLTYAVVDNDL